MRDNQGSVSPRTELFEMFSVDCYIVKGNRNWVVSESSFKIMFLEITKYLGFSLKQLFNTYLFQSCDYLVVQNGRKMYKNGISVTIQRKSFLPVLVKWWAGS